jgi:hypothetical protein
VQIGDSRAGSAPTVRSIAAEVDRAGVALPQNPAVVDLDAQNVVQASDDRGEPYLMVVRARLACR